MEVCSLVEAVGRLPERHRHVLVRRYGLDDSDTSTLTDPASELGICKERVRQLQREAEWALRTRHRDGARLRGGGKSING